jgi:hypothetical protein
MDQADLLMEYLKEQYTQARQHETLRTNATTFLTAAAGITIGFLFKEGQFQPDLWWIGGLIALIGVANFLINRAHFFGNRFHTSLAGKTRHALEERLGPWTGNAPTDLRQVVLEQYDMAGPGKSVGGRVNKAIMCVPIGVICVGLLIVLLGILKISCIS